MIEIIKPGQEVFLDGCKLSKFVLIEAQIGYNGSVTYMISPVFTGDMSRMTAELVSSFRVTPCDRGNLSEIGFK